MLQAVVHGVHGDRGGGVHVRAGHVFPGGGPPVHRPNQPPPLQLHLQEQMCPGVQHLRE